MPGSASARAAASIHSIWRAKTARRPRSASWPTPTLMPGRAHRGAHVVQRACDLPRQLSQHRELFPARAGRSLRQATATDETGFRIAQAPGRAARTIRLAGGRRFGRSITAGTIWLRRCGRSSLTNAAARALIQLNVARNRYAHQSARPLRSPDDGQGRARRRRRTSCVRRVYYVDYASSRLPQNLDAQQRDMESSVFAVTLAGVQAFDHSTSWHHYDQSFVGRNYFRVQEPARPVRFQQSRRWRRHGTSVLAAIDVVVFRGSWVIVCVIEYPVTLSTLTLFATISTLARSRPVDAPFATAIGARCDMQKCRSPVQTGRIASVDALRGFNIISILGGDAAIWTLDGMLRRQGANSERGREFPRHATQPCPRWEGFRFYDFIFPLFIFVTGASDRIFRSPRLAEREGKTRSASVGAAQVASAVRVGVDLLRRRERFMWPDIRSARRAPAHRTLLFVRIAVVPELPYAGIDRRPLSRYSSAIGRLMTSCQCPGSASAPSPWCQSRQLDRRALSAGQEMGRDARSGGAAQHAAGDRYLSARRVRRLAAEG